MQTARRTLAIALLCASALHSPTSAAASLDTRSLKAEALFRLANPCPATGVSNGPCKGYVIDRIIPVICGGVEEPANMKWQTLAEAREKDKWERIGCRPGRAIYRPERPVVIEAFPLNEAERVEAAPLTAGEQSPRANAPPADAEPIEPDR
jgi:hypothetical protein